MAIGRDKEKAVSSLELHSHLLLSSGDFDFVQIWNEIRVGDDALGRPSLLLLIPTHLYVICCRERFKASLDCSPKEHDERDRLTWPNLMHSSGKLLERGGCRRTSPHPCSQQQRIEDLRTDILPGIEQGHCYHAASSWLRRCL